MEGSKEAWCPRYDGQSAQVVPPGNEGKNLPRWEVNGPNQCEELAETGLLYGNCNFQPLCMCCYGEMIGEGGG